MRAQLPFVFSEAFEKMSTDEFKGDAENRARYRIVSMEFDPSAPLNPSRDAEHERNIAIFDLMEDNFFRPEGSNGGPYGLVLGIEDNRVAFEIRLEDGTPHGKLVLSLTPFRRIVRDYFMVCESYYEAIRHATPQQIEAIDMGRRGLHNEGAELLVSRLNGKIEVDNNTARRLFTLLCALHFRS